MVSLSIVIVNFNTKELLINCLYSIFKNKPKFKLEVIIIDNASKDESAKITKKLFPDVKIIENKKNTLYSKANNQGLKMASGRYVLVLNSDTLLQNNTLRNMIRFMENHKNCALASCREVDTNGKTIRTCHKFHTPFIQILEMPLFFKFYRNSSLLRSFHYESWNRKSTKKVDTIPGSFMFARRGILKKIGFFDENLKLFFSDADLCKRVSDQGYNIYHNGKVTITHFSSKTLNQLPLISVYSKSYKDMIYYYKKHFGVIWAIILFILSRINLAIFNISSK